MLFRSRGRAGGGVALAEFYSLADSSSLPTRSESRALSYATFSAPEASSEGSDGPEGIGGSGDAAGVDGAAGSGVTTAPAVTPGGGLIGSRGM